MAYAFEVEGPESVVPGDGNRYLVYTVTETDVSPGDVWSITSFPNLAVVTLLQAELTTPGTATSIQPALSKEATVDDELIDFVGQADEAGAAVRIGTNKRCGPGSTLYGCSNVDQAGGATSEVVTRLVVAIGHAP